MDLPAIASAKTAALSLAVFILLLKPLRGLYHLFIAPFFSPLRNVPGPPRQSWLLGNILLSRKLTPAVARRMWMKEYGPIFTTWSYFGVRVPLPRVWYLLNVVYVDPKTDFGG